MSTPCVYILHPVDRKPSFFVSCDAVWRAELVAKRLQEVYNTPAWVADWKLIAHQPRHLEVAFIPSLTGVTLH